MTHFYELSEAQNCLAFGHQLNLVRTTSAHSKIKNAPKLQFDTWFMIHYNCSYESYDIQVKAPDSLTKADWKYVRTVSGSSWIPVTHKLGFKLIYGFCSNRESLSTISHSVLSLRSLTTRETRDSKIIHFEYPPLKSSFAKMQKPSEILQANLQFLFNPLYHIIRTAGWLS